MKKILSLILALTMLTALLCGCGAPKTTSVLDLSKCRTERLDPVDHETNYVQIELAPPSWTPYPKSPKSKLRTWTG